MPIEKWSDNVIVAHLADEPQFSEDVAAIEHHIEAGSNDVVIDFATIEFLNSSNLSSLLRLRRLIASKSRRLVLCSIPNQIWGTFLVTGLDKVFEFSGDVTTALATLQMA